MLGTLRRRDCQRCCSASAEVGVAPVRRLGECAGRARGSRESVVVLERRTAGRLTLPRRMRDL
jgi:hypothetical protein